MKRLALGIDDLLVVLAQLASLCRHDLYDAGTLMSVERGTVRVQPLGRLELAILTGVMYRLHATVGRRVKRGAMCRSWP